jgi:hypothetical protein
MVGGDFNLIYRDEDKNKAVSNRRMMGRFRRALDDLQLKELHLHGRLYTWSNECDDPILERIDRVFSTHDWEDLFPDHMLNGLSSNCSDHSPLLLRTSSAFNIHKRFHFENCWPKFEGYLDTVQAA